jgi:endoglycosylceramidase
MGRASAKQSCPARSRLWCAGIALVIAAGLGAGGGVARAAGLPVLSHHGRWLTDANGRVVILHGVQVDRFEPGQPVEYIDLSASNVRFMARQGFNLARVSMAFAGVEPRPGVFDQGYVDSYLAFDRLLAHSGVYDLVDMMQGQYSPLVGGWGFPNWMTDIGLTPNRPQAFPDGYFANPAVDTAWDNLWHDGRASDGSGILDDYASGLSRLARQYAATPGLLGMEILNEPWPGTPWATCASPVGCPPAGFDQTSLSPAYRRLIAAIRSTDARHPVLYEPNLLFDYGAPTRLRRLGGPNLVFAFHNYCLAYAFAIPDPLGDCRYDEQIVFANAAAREAQSGDGLLMDEWGNTNNTTTIERIAAEADQHMVGWSYWAYEDCCNSLGAVVRNGAEDPEAAGNLNVPVLEALVRPYPQLTSGTPMSWSFDPASKTFRFKYSTTGVDGRRFAAGSPTEVFIPQLQYTHGYRVAVTGADISSKPTAGRLLLCSRRGATEVSVSITSSTAGRTDIPVGPGVRPACPRAR